MPKPTAAQRITALEQQLAIEIERARQHRELIAQLEARLDKAALIVHRLVIHAKATATK